MGFFSIILAYVGLWIIPFLATPLQQINFEILFGYWIATFNATVAPPLDPSRYGLSIFTNKKRYSSPFC